MLRIPMRTAWISGSGREDPGDAYRRSLPLRSSRLGVLGPKAPKPLKSGLAQSVK